MQKHQAVGAWLQLLAESVGIGAIVFEVGFDRFAHYQALPALVALVASAFVPTSGGKPLAALGSLFSNLHFSVSTRDGLQIDLNQPQPDQLSSPPTKNSAAEARTSRTQPNSEGVADVQASPSSQPKPLAPPAPRDDTTPGSPER